MNIYLPSGYLNIPKIVDLGYPFIFICGARGIGKSYGALQYVYDNKIKFILLRRTQSQIDLINKPEFSPFKALNEDFNWNVIASPITKYNAGFYEGILNENGKLVPAGPPIGYTAALSTLSNLRGFDASDVDLIIYDEFIPERHERPIKEEGAALLNAYETINRNRELKGKQPVKLLCLANANDLGNAVFRELGLIHKAEKMRLKGQDFSADDKRGIIIIMPDASPISEQKRQTALYRLSGSGTFASMALDNEFAEMRSKTIKACPISEYRPIAFPGELSIYKHKSKNDYYCSSHRQGSAPEYDSSETDLSRFTRAHYYLWTAYMQARIYFEDVTCEILFTNYFTKN